MTSRASLLTGWPSLAQWRAQRRASPGWTAVVATIVVVILAPIVSIATLALTSGIGSLPQLLTRVLPGALFNTLTLAVVVGSITLTVGTASAWLVTMYRFPGRAWLDRLLILPLAMPTYIVAYCYGDLLDYAGPLQTALRSMFGWTRPSDYWFPDVRSLGGAALILSLVLYPYVYLAARASFVQQSVCVLEVARTLGRTPMGAFWSVALPLARPALAAGVALVLMEVLNELGAVQHLGIETLSASIYTTWLQRSNLAGASQLAVLVLIFVAAIISSERALRGSALTHATTNRHRSIPFQDISGTKGLLAGAFCIVPCLFGFMIPTILLIRNAWTHARSAFDGGLLNAALNSIFLASLAALIAVAIALVLTYARRVAGNGFTRPAVRFAGLGYAIPGTVLALGLLIPLAGFDNWLDAIVRHWTGLSTGLLLSGSVFALTLAYVIRFLAVALGGVEAGFERISPNLDAAARALGETALSALWRVHLPILLPSLGAAGLMVFVDTMKELPATLLLRPFDFETLATHVYNFAAIEQVESGALGALAIVAVGLIPVILLHTAVAGGRAGS